MSKIIKYIIYTMCAAIVIYCVIKLIVAKCCYFNYVYIFLITAAIMIGGDYATKDEG